MSYDPAAAEARDQEALASYDRLAEDGPAEDAIDYGDWYDDEEDD